MGLAREPLTTLLPFAPDTKVTQQKVTVHYILLTRVDLKRTNLICFIKLYFPTSLHDLSHLPTILHDLSHLPTTLHNLSYLPTILYNLLFSNRFIQHSYLLTVLLSR